MGGSIKTTVGTRSLDINFRRERGEEASEGVACLNDFHPFLA